MSGPGEAFLRFLWIQVYTSRVLVLFACARRERDVALAASRMRFVRAGIDSWMFEGSGREEILEVRV